MRILFHAINYAPNSQADARRITGLAENLKLLGCIVDVATVYPDRVKGKKRRLWFFQFARKEVINDVYIYRYFTVPFNNKGSFRRLINNLSFAISSFFHIFRFRYYDVVITTSPPLLISHSGRLIARFKGAKLIFDIRDIWPDIAIDLGGIKEESFTARVFNLLANKMYKDSDLITTVSELKVKALENKRINKDKIKLISNGVDEGFLKTKETNAFLDEYKFNSFFSIVHIGKIGLAQDLDLLLDLAKRYIKDDNIRVFLLGDGVERNKIEGRIIDEKITNVLYLGERSSEEAYTALKHAKLSFVSLKNEKLKDSVPTKLLESLYLGSPVLLSAKGEAVKILNTSKFGLASNPGDLNMLISNFEYMYKNYEEVYSNKEFCFNYINNQFNRKKISRELLFYLESLERGNNES